MKEERKIIIRKKGGKKWEKLNDDGWMNRFILSN